MTSTPCQGIVGRIFGHKFQPRYSSDPRKLTFDNFEGSAAQFDAMIRSSSKRTYHGDVCVRCGLIRKEDSNAC